MLNYQAALDGSQVVLRIDSVQGDLGFFVSSDYWLRIDSSIAGSSGILGFGACEILIDSKNLPLTLHSPNYEHQADLDHVLEKLISNLDAYNTNPSPFTPRTSIHEEIKAKLEANNGNPIP